MIIRIKNLAVGAVIGVLEHERTRKQDIFINIEMRVDATEAAAKDDLQKAVDYAGIADKVKELGSASSFNLLEALAAEEAAGTFMLRGLSGEYPNWPSGRPRALDTGSRSAG